jgi:hypothetical protein
MGQGVVRQEKGLCGESLQDRALIARTLLALRGRYINNKENNIQPIW